MRVLVLLAASVLSLKVAVAQTVPARDLMASPIGLIGAPAALADGAAAGMWNPATGLLENGDRVRAGVAALNAPVDVALTGQVISLGFRLRSRGSISASLTRAGVADLVRTETDPQSIGGDIPYGIWVSTLGYAHRVTSHLIVGGAARWLSGRVDRERRDRGSVDVGVVADHLGPFDARLAASSFLQTLDAEEPTTLLAAGDARVFQRDSTLVVRAGVGMMRTPRAITELYPHITGQLGRVLLRGGPVHVSAFGTTTWRSRLAITLEQDRFTIGVVQESNTNGLTPTYQIAVSTQRR